MNKITEFVNFATNIEYLIYKAKQEFEFLITDTSTPLEARWKLFGGAANYLKNHSQWIVRVPFPDGSEFEFDHNSGYEKHTVHDLVDLVEGIKEGEFGETLPEDYNWEDSEGDFRKFTDSDKVVFVKEYVLKNNLGSFCMDW